MTGLALIGCPVAVIADFLEPLAPLIEHVILGFVVTYIALSAMTLAPIDTPVIEHVEHAPEIGYIVPVLLVISSTPSPQFPA